MPKKRAKTKRRTVSTERLNTSKRASARKANASAAQDKALREHLVSLLKWSDAHVDFEKAIAGFPPELRGTKPQGVPHSAWQLLEHLRIAQWDILEFSRDPRHVSPPFPEGYWPDSPTPPNETAWDQSVNAYRRDLMAMEALIAGPSTDLCARIQHGSGQTILREVLLLADHNAYHVAQLIALRRLLGAWPTS